MKLRTAEAGLIAEHERLLHERNVEHAKHEQLAKKAERANNAAYTSYSRLKELNEAIASVERALQSIS